MRRGESHGRQRLPWPVSALERLHPVSAAGTVGGRNPGLAAVLGLPDGGRKVTGSAGRLGPRRITMTALYSRFGARFGEENVR